MRIRYLNSFQTFFVRILNLIYKFIYLFFHIIYYFLFNKTNKMKSYTKYEITIISLLFVFESSELLQLFSSINYLQKCYKNLCIEQVFSANNMRKK